ncbi:hypothetical protein L6R46_07065 [Myxococcota bacterium]|jgi:hypothetical protein|nr:hypothetical protein [Myxococcota bacterium]
MLTATLTTRRLHCPDVKLLTADLMQNGLALVMDRTGDARLCVRWLDEGGQRGPPLLWDDDICGDGMVYDPETDRLVVALNGPPHVFEGTSGVCLGVLPHHDQPTYRATVAPGGRVVTETIEGVRRVTDLRTLTRLAEHSTRTCRGWSAPVGLLPGDPVLTCRSYVRDGQWGTALVNAQTGRDVARVRRPFGGGPAFQSAAPRPNALEWVGVLAKGDDRGFEPSELMHFTPEGAQIIHSAPSRRVGPDQRSLPGIVRLSFLTNDWLYTEGARRPHQAIHLPTGTRRDCPSDDMASQTGQVIDRRAVAVLDLDTGIRAPLYSGDAPEEGRSVKAISADGGTVLVSTPEALEWWSITR